jgi:hypothetical protein
MLRQIATSLVAKNPATFGQHFPAIRWDSARSQGTVLLSVVWFPPTWWVAVSNSESKIWVSLTPAGAHTPPAPVREETKNLKENARRALQHAVEHRPRVDAAKGRARSTAIDPSMAALPESAVATLVGASGVKMMRCSVMLNGGVASP